MRCCPINVFSTGSTLYVSPSTVNSPLYYTHTHTHTHTHMHAYKRRLHEHEQFICSCSDAERPRINSCQLTLNDRACSIDPDSSLTDACEPDTKRRPMLWRCTRGHYRVQSVCSSERAETCRVDTVDMQTWRIRVES